MSNSLNSVRLPKITELPAWLFVETAETTQTNAMGILENTRELVEHHSNVLRDLVIYAKPTKASIVDLWVENLSSLEVLLQQWIFPLKGLLDKIGKLSNEELWPEPQAVRAEEMGPVRFASLLERLQVAISNILSQIKCLKDCIRYRRSPFDPGHVSRRPASEISLHAILIAQESPNSERILLSFNRVRANIRRDILELQQHYPRVPWLSTLPTKNFKSTGHCQVLEALWVGKEQLFTGATLPQLRGLEKLHLHTDRGGSSTIKDWLRDTRYQRFTTEEQDTLKELITFQMVSTYMWRLRELGVGLPIELDKLPNKEKKQAGAYLAKEIDRLPFSLLNTYLGGNSNHVGLAYNGSTFEPREKCVMCQGTYIFPEAREEWPARTFWSFGELTNWNKGKGPCGCCAEALVFVRSLKSVDRWPRFVREVRDLPLPEKWNSWL